MGQFPPKRVKYLATPSSIFVFISSSSTGELSALSQSEARLVELGEYSQNCWAKLSGPRIQLRRISTNTPNYIREAKVLYSADNPNNVREQMFAQLRTGFTLHYHHQNDSDGSDESRLNVSLIVRDKVTKTVTTSHNFWREKRTVAESNRSPSCRCCLMSSDVGWHIRDKLRPVREHGSV